MDAQINQALAHDRVIDITTYGRTSGEPYRKEIWFHNLDGVLYITGTPGRRDWYANLVARPDFIFHLKESATADLRARATPVTDPETKRAVLSRILHNINRTDNVEDWVARSPLVQVDIVGQ